MKRLWILFLVFLLLPFPVKAKSEETIKLIKDQDGNVIGKFIFPKEWVVEQDKYVFNIKLGSQEIGFISINPFNTLEKEKAKQKELATEDGLDFHEQLKISPEGVKYYYYTLTNPNNPSYLAEKYVADLDDAIISFNINHGKDNHYALDFINMIDTDRTVPQDYVEPTTEEEETTEVKEEKKEEKKTLWEHIQDLFYELFRVRT